LLIASSQKPLLMMLDKNRIFYQMNSGTYYLQKKSKLR